MIQDRIDKIEAMLKGATNLSNETREELLTLLANLKVEVASLTATHGDDAQSIARFTDASVHEVTRTEKKADLAEAALKGLTSSVVGLEVSHPRLVEIVNRLALTLSNMGI